jgi:hypothetical protein
MKVRRIIVSLMVLTCGLAAYLHHQDVARNSHKEAQ